MEIIAYLQKNYLEIIGTVLSLICVWLNTKAHIGGWVVGILATAVYAAIAFQAQLYGFFIINIFFLVLSVYGWLYWLIGKNTDNELPITTLKTQEVILYLVVGGLAILPFAYLLQYFGGKMVWIDASTTAFSVIAQWLLARKKIENWIFWVVINFCYVVMFIASNYWISMCLYVCLFILAIQGWLTWKKLLQQANNLP
jgi:nicotinamide mononucleotide transporter